MAANWLDEHDAVALGGMLRQGEISASELLEAVLARIDQRNATVNAVVQRMDEQARQQAKAYRADLAASPLAGVPLLIKDLLADVAGVHTGNGCHAFDDAPLPKQDAEIVRRYRAAGLVLAGKTATPELGLYPYTESKKYGATRNPWDKSRTPGGSSGGAGAALAARMVPLAHGGDGGGSLRIPASNCGVFGLKPSRGRSPQPPGLAEWWQGFVSEHALTRSVRDSAAMLDVLCNTAGSNEIPLYHAAPPPAGGFLQALQQPVGKLRVAFTLQPFTDGEVSSDARAVVEKTAALLQSLGHTVEEARPPIASAEVLGKIMQTYVAASMAHFVRLWRERTGHALDWRKVEPATWAISRYGEQISAGQMVWARETALQQGLVLQAFHQKYDVLLTPTMNQLPAPIGSLAMPPGEEKLTSLFIGQLGMDWILKVSPQMQQAQDRLLHYMGWPVLANMTGQPAMSVPLHWSAPTASAPAGLPLGAMFAGRMGDEVTLLRLAQQLEQAQAWWDKAPPVAARV